MITINYVKDPTNPIWDNDAAMKQYRTIIAKYGGGVNPNDYQVMYGVAKAETFVQLLYRAGKNPTRASLMAAQASMNYPNRFLLPGVVQKTSRTDHFIISQMQLIRYAHPDWVRTGQLIEGRPSRGK
jgi:branched-chain amino acid transport system substrate-binding protein